MMRKLPDDPGHSTCSEHGGRFDNDQAARHLLAEHEALSRSAERILDANRNVLPVNPSIAHYDTGEAPARQNRAERRAAQRRARRGNGGRP